MSDKQTRCVYIITPTDTAYRVYVTNQVRLFSCLTGNRRSFEQPRYFK